MATVWTFGDSLTAPYSEDYDWSNNYIKWKGYIPKVYGDIISDQVPSYRFKEAIILYLMPNLSQNLAITTV